MSGSLVDLAKFPFWAALIVAVLLLAPMARGQHRSWVFTAINLGFISFLLGWVSGLAVLVGCVIAWSLAVGLRKAGPNLPLVIGALLVVSFPFVLHKLPSILHAMSLEAVNPVLSLIAYSYILLRLVDLFRAMWEARFEAPSLIETINYVIPFHMLAAGPIQSYEEYVTQPGEPRELSDGAVLEGLQRIAFGAFKKFVVAAAIDDLFLTGFSTGGLYWWLEVQMCFLWLYIDFSAYSDIAVGIGRILGVHTPENFNRPYLARNMIVFWERWHISLSMWIRRNLFYPIQFSLIRRTEGRWPLLCASFAFTAAFLLCGLWHAVSWTFFAWGALHALGLVTVNLYRAQLSQRLGSKGVKAYMANPVARVIAIGVTFEWVALANVVVFLKPL